MSALNLLVHLSLGKEATDNYDLSVELLELV